jgi:peptidoglycan/xylan/chitin deacetylase (PgdA/CDA1 family)
MQRVSPARVAFFVATTGLAGLGAERALLATPSWPLLATATFGWSALMTTGVFFPWLEMFGRIVCRGPAGQGRVALTFDDGPDPRTTPRVLDALAGTRHRATFFVLGHKVRRHPEVVRAIHRAGHDIGLHGDLHDRLHSFRMPGRVRDELRRAQDAVESAVGVRPSLFRPPIGHTSPATVYGARLAQTTLIGWSARGYDGIRSRTPEAVMTAVSASLEDGAIVLLHDAAEHDDFEPASLAAMPALKALLDERQLTSVGLQGWLAEASRLTSENAKLKVV